MQIDHPVGVGLDHVVGDEEKESRQDDKVDVVAVEQLKFLGFLLRLVVFVDGNHLKRDVELLTNNLQVGVIADDKRDFDIPLAGGVSCQEVVDAMRHLGNKDSHALHMFGETDAECHIVALAVEGAEIIADFLFRDYKFRQIPLHPHVKHSVVPIHILVEIEDIAAIFVDKTGDYGDDATLVGAVHTQNGMIMLFH